MRPWQPGAPIATGRVYLPDVETRNAYMRECARQQQIPGWVRYVLAGTSREQRRQRLAESPEEVRGDVRARVEAEFNQREGE